MKTKKALALTELIIAIVMISSIIAMSLSIYVFFSRQIMINRERYNMLSQINYAFEDMAIRTKSAVRVNSSSVFSLASGAISDTKNTFRFFGEKKIYEVTPDNDSDNTWYEYRIQNGGLILEVLDEIGDPKDPPEILPLVDAKYHPTTAFTWYEGYEPNFITVTVTTTGTIPPLAHISRTQGLRFWFIDVKK
jgi:hypothetical protein